jgi:hypothetical protein
MLLIYVAEQMMEHGYFLYRGCRLIRSHIWSRWYVVLETSFRSTVHGTFLTNSSFVKMSRSCFVVRATRVSQHTKKAFSSNSGSKTIANQRPLAALTAGFISVSAMAVSPFLLLKQQKHTLASGSDSRRQACDLYTPTDRVRLFSGMEVVEESKQLHDEIHNLVLKHGEERIKRQLIRSAEVSRGEPEEIISLGDIDPNLLSNETVRGLIMALKQGARFDEQSLGKLHRLSS